VSKNSKLFLQKNFSKLFKDCQILFLLKPLEIAAFLSKKEPAFKKPVLKIFLN